MIAARRYRIDLEITDFPDIAIVIPTLNEEDLILPKLEDLKNSDYPETRMSIIVIDGGSTDDSVNIIKKYERHLSFWCSEPDGGHYSAVNKGFTKASGDVFAWLNSDDLYCQGALKTVGSIFGSLPQVQWLTSLTPLTWDKQDFCTDAGCIPGFSKEAFLNGINLPWDGTWTIGQESTFWRCSLWGSVNGINSEFELAGDFDLWARFFKQTKLFGVSSPLGVFRLHEQQRSHQSSEYRKEARASLDAMRLELQWDKKISPSRSRNSEPDSQVVRILNAGFRKLHSRKYVGKKVNRIINKNGDNFWQEEDVWFAD